MTSPPPGPVRFRTRLAPILFLAAMLASIAFIWRATERPAPGGGPIQPEAAHDPAPVRGGRLVAALRATPRSFNRLSNRDATTELVSMLTEGRLVRVNRETFEVEPWLAERWESSADGRVHTLHLRPNVVWSDGTPFTSADVLFTLDAVFDPKTASVLADSLTVARQPIRAAAPDDRTVVVTYAGPSGLGVGLLDNLPIYPKHKLEAARKAGALGAAWPIGMAPEDFAGTGPFVPREYQPGVRLVLDRNPRYWRTGADGMPLPYLDRLVLEIAPEPGAELLRVTSGEIALVQDAIRTEDVAAARRAEREGKLTVAELGVGTDPDVLWFCLNEQAKKRDPRFAFVRKREFRQALSHAVDREAFARDVFLGEAVPIWGPVTPGNTPWFDPNVRRYPPDADRARALLKSIGLEDRNGNGIVEDAHGTEARFTVITQEGPSWYARGMTVVSEAAAAVGIRLDVAKLTPQALTTRIPSCDYDAIYFRVVATSLDPASNLDFWLSSGDAHFWNPGQKTPATEWEARVDGLMVEQAASTDAARRKALFDEAQQILGEEVPALYFAAPRLYTAYAPRVHGVKPSVLRPPVLWNAEALFVTMTKP